MQSHRNGVLLISITLALAAFALLSVTTPPIAFAASSGESRTFTVIVSRYGFNGTAGTLSITIQQGDLVRITFVYGDNDLTVDNPHAIMIDGYRIQTVNIGKSNPSVTVEFTADVSGTFTFYCYMPCLGMEKMLGHLIVTPSQNQRIPTSLDLAALKADSEPSGYQITATAVDETGTPLVEVPIAFYENTTFGRLFLGTVATDSSGIAVLTFHPSRIGIVQIIAENQGNTQFANSSKSILITVASGATQTEGQVYLDLGQPNQPFGVFYGISFPSNLSMIGVTRSANIFVALVAGFVLLGVWSTYAYVGRQIGRISKYGEEQRDIGSPLSPKMEIPVDTSGSIDMRTVTAWKNMLGLLVVASILGVADVLLVNAIGRLTIWTLMSLVGLAAVESAAVVVLATSGKMMD